MTESDESASEPQPSTSGASGSQMPSTMPSTGRVAFAGTRAPTSPRVVLLCVVAAPVLVVSTLFTYGFFARIGFVSALERSCPGTTEQCACIVGNLKENTSWLDNLAMGFDHSLAEQAGRDAAFACMRAHTDDTRGDTRDDVRDDVRGDATRGDMRSDGAATAAPLDPFPR